MSLFHNQQRLQLRVTRSKAKEQAHITYTYSMLEISFQPKWDVKKLQLTKFPEQLEWELGTLPNKWQENTKLITFAWYTAKNEIGVRKVSTYTKPIETSSGSQIYNRMKRRGPRKLSILLQRRQKVSLLGFELNFAIGIVLRRSDNKPYS